MTRLHLLISGRVQGVFYRKFTRRVALNHGLSGWVRNLADGRVEVVLEGDRTKVLVVMEKLKKGPPRARVEKIDEREDPPEGLAGFLVRD